ncbi:MULTISPECIES: hypothetical protein [Haloarcula]|uniref:hypothetical protein n=1 Tax=Haloarcula TaxID=2237 RepID=UPI0023ED75E0|nr:hypothetical protein [Halomicroarcula sp. XH51]
MAGKLKLLVVAGLAVATLLGAGVAFGVPGATSVESAENHFGSVSETTTAVTTDLRVSNPNPVRVQLGGVSANDTVGTNGIRMPSWTRGARP